MKDSYGGKDLIENDNISRYNKIEIITDTLKKIGSSFTGPRTCIDSSFVHIVQEFLPIPL